MSDVCHDCGETPCTCPPCDETRPCRAEYQSDDDLCCFHDGLCRDESHPHYDRDAHNEWLIDGYVEREAERRMGGLS